MSEIGSVSEERSDVYFEWKIPDFSSLGANSTDYFDSPAFSASGCKWKLRVYPKSWSNWLWFYLWMSDSENTNKTATFTLGLKRSDGRLEEKEPLSWTFQKGMPLWGYDRFWDLDDLQRRKSELAPSDTLTLTCRMQNGAPYPARVIPQAFDIIELETLSSNFKDLLISKKKCDIIIKVKDREFQVHKAVLMARSSVFAAMFEHDLSEEETGVVTVPDCDPDSFGDFLHYLYTAKIEDVSFAKAHHLYVTCDKYDVQDLKSFCVKYMIQHLSVENVGDAVALADRHDDTELLSSSQFFFNRNFSKIVSTAGWEKLFKENFGLANSLLQKMAPKIKVEE